MKKVVGNVVAIVGLAVMALSFGLFKVEWAIFDTIPQVTITIVGIIGVVVGVVISLMDKKKGGRKSKQEDDEVPIYSGEGKGRKIVGYQRK